MTRLHAQCYDFGFGVTLPAKRLFCCTTYVTKHKQTEGENILVSSPNCLQCQGRPFWSAKASQSTNAICKGNPPRQKNDAGRQQHCDQCCRPKKTQYSDHVTQRQYVSRWALENVSTAKSTKEATDIPPQPRHTKRRTLCSLSYCQLRIALFAERHTTSRNDTAFKKTTTKPAIVDHC